MCTAGSVLLPSVDLFTLVRYDLASGEWSTVLIPAFPGLNPCRLRGNQPCDIARWTGQGETANVWVPGKEPA